VANKFSAKSDLNGIWVVRVVGFGSDFGFALEAVRIGTVARGLDCRLIVDVANSLCRVRSRPPLDPWSRLTISLYQ
jgi:hypothetical protein